MTDTPREQLDAIELLMQDHRELESLFREFEYIRTQEADAGDVIDAACAEITTHDTLKSELFCRAMLDAADEPGTRDLLAQVEEGHRAIRDLVARVTEAEDDRAQRDAQFSVLSQRVERQFEIAETEVFPRARRARRLDLAAVTERIKARRNELAQRT